MLYILAFFLVWFFLAFGLGVAVGRLIKKNPNV